MTRTAAATTLGVQHLRFGGTPPVRSTGQDTSPNLGRRKPAAALPFPISGDGLKPRSRLSLLLPSLFPVGSASKICPPSLTFASSPHIRLCHSASILHPADIEPFKPSL